MDIAQGAILVLVALLLLLICRVVAARLQTSERPPDSIARGAGAIADGAAPLTAEELLLAKAASLGANEPPSNEPQHEGGR